MSTLHKWTVCTFRPSFTDERFFEEVDLAWIGAFGAEIWDLEDFGALNEVKKELPQMHFFKFFGPSRVL